MSFVKIDTTDITSLLETTDGNPKHSTHGLGITECAHKLYIACVPNNASSIAIWHQNDSNGWDQIDTSAISGMNDDTSIGITHYLSDHIVIATIRDAGGEGVVEVWDYDGTSWTQFNTSDINATSIPNDNDGGVDITTNSSGNLVLAVNDDPSSSSNYHYASAHVWEYDGANWTQISNGFSSDIMLLDCNGGLGISKVSDYIAISLINIKGSIYGKPWVTVCKYDDGTWSQIPVYNITSHTEPNGSAGVSITENACHQPVVAVINRTTFSDYPHYDEGEVHIWQYYETISGWAQLNTNQINTPIRDRGPIATTVSGSGKINVVVSNHINGRIELWQQEEATDCTTPPTLQAIQLPETTPILFTDYFPIADGDYQYFANLENIQSGTVYKFPDDVNPLTDILWICPSDCDPKYIVWCLC